MNEIIWNAPEFIHYPKSKWWFVILFAGGFSLTGFSLWQKDFITAVLFALLTAVIAFFSVKKPKTLQIKITGSAVEYGVMRIPMHQIKKFWIVYEPPLVKTLNFETAAYINRSLTIQLMDTNPVELRKFLLQYLPEQIDRQEDFSQKLSRKLKF